jgi:hypothetical protein
MKKTLLKFVACTVGALAMLSESGVAQSGRLESNRIVGTWMFHVQLQDCGTGANLGQPFLSLLTFDHSGTVVETTANGMFYPAVRSAGHGIWGDEERDSVRASTTAFITLNGVLQRIQTIDQRIELDGPNALHTTAASVRFVSPTGVPLASGCASATATRLRFE